jgi:hypothetical protein
MRSTFCSVFFVAFLYGIYSSAMHSHFSGQSAELSPPVAPTDPKGPSIPTIRVSENNRDPIPYLTWCYIAQARPAVGSCQKDLCRRFGGLCLPNEEGTRCKQHIDHFGGAFPNRIESTKWPCWQQTKRACRGCACRKHRQVMRSPHLFSRARVTIP